MKASGIKWWIGGCAALAAGAALGWSFGPSRKPFDAAAWQDERQARRRNVRLKMADHIVATKMLSGKTRAEVVALLGEPPPTEYFKSWDLVYWLGPERGFISIDSEWLVVKLDAQGKVSDYRIVRD